MKKALTTMLWCFVFAAYGVSVVSNDSNQVLVVNGKKVFPICLSPGPPLNGVTPEGKDALQEFRDTGALFYRMAQTNAWTDQTITDQQAALDWCAQHDMYAIVNLRELSAFSATDTNTPVKLTNVVNTFKNHPALGYWKNKDEAWWGGTSADDLKRGYDLIRQCDTNHPIQQTHAPRGTVADLQPYNAAADIINLDIYPIGYPPGANSLGTNKQISMIGDYAAFLSQISAGQRPFWMTEQIAWSGVVPPGKTLHFPNYEQERYMAYQAIINGARGLVFFGGNIAATLNAQDAPLDWNWTFWNQTLKPVVQQLGDKGLLTDALTTTNSTRAVTMTGATAPDVEFCVREAGSYLYVLACKRESTTLQVTFNGLPTFLVSGDLLYESPRNVTVTGGKFSDWFGPNEVHVYRFVITNQVVTPTNGLVLYEPFAYTNIGGAVSLNTPANWSTNGSGANDLNVTSNSLSYAGLATSLGNSVTNGGVGLGVRRLFNATVTNGLVYFSALFQVNDFGSWSGSSAQVGALTAPDNQNFRLAVMAQKNGTNFVLGVQKGGTGATTVFDNNTLHNLGETIFLVGKYDFNQTPNVVYLWANPASSNFGSTNEPAGFISNITGADGYTIDRFNIRQNTASSVPSAMRWDELRVGTSWADVTPTH